MTYRLTGLGGNFLFKFPFAEKVAGLQRVTGLDWPLYGWNFTKDHMGVWQGNELLACLQRVAGL